MDYAKKYKKLSKKYHMKNRRSNSYVIVYIALIYLVLIINTCLSIYRLNKVDISSVSIFMNVPYIVVVLLLSLISFISFFRSNKNKKELLYIILTMIISLIIVPYLFYKPIIIVLIFGILIFVCFIKTPTTKIKETKESYQSNEPVILKYSEDTEIYKKGIMIYKKNKTGENSICSASAFEHGDVIIIKGNQKIDKI